jgi:hypothetical protein
MGEIHRGLRRFCYAAILAEKSGEDGWLSAKQDKRRGEQSRIHNTNKMGTACCSEFLGSFGVLRGLNLLLVCIERAPADSEQKITKKRKLIGVRQGGIRRLESWEGRSSGARRATTEQRS